METDLTMQAVIAVLQTALTPAFLLVALVALLNLYAGRLSRIVDRIRMLEARHAHADAEELRQIVHELRLQEKRVVVVSLSILLGVLACLSVCVMIGLLFLMGLSHLVLTIWIIASFLFSLGMLAGSLLLYVREVQLATRCIHVRKELLNWPQAGVIDGGSLH